MSEIGSDDKIWRRKRLLLCISRGTRPEFFRRRIVNWNEWRFIGIYTTDKIFVVFSRNNFKTIKEYVTVQDLFCSSIFLFPKPTKPWIFECHERLDFSSTGQQLKVNRSQVISKSLICISENEKICVFGRFL